MVRKPFFSYFRTKTNSLPFGSSGVPGKLRESCQTLEQFQRSFSFYFLESYFLSCSASLPPGRLRESCQAPPISRKSFCRLCHKKISLPLSSLGHTRRLWASCQTHKHHCGLVGFLFNLVTQDQQREVRSMPALMVSNMPADIDLANRRYLLAKSEAGCRYTLAGYPDWVSSRLDT